MKKFQNEADCDHSSPVIPQPNFKKNQYHSSKTGIRESVSSQTNHSIGSKPDNTPYIQARHAF